MNTAIEQLKKEFYSYAEPRGLDNDQWLIDEQDLERLFEKYKQMEKQQMEDAYSYGIGETSQWDSIKNMFDQYYKDEFDAAKH